MTRTVTVRYSGQRPERLAAALADATGYLSGDILATLYAFLRNVQHSPARPRHKRSAAYMACEFAGLRGLPATAIIKDAWRA